MLTQNRLHLNFAEEHLWENHFDMWRSTREDGPINMGWHERRLNVNAGGFTFSGKLAEGGTYTWSESGL